MFDVLISGKLLKDPKPGVSRNGNPFTTVSIRVPVPQQNEGDPDSVFASAIAFGEEAKKLARLASGDTVCVNGAARPTQWEKDGKQHHGLSVTVNAVMTSYILRRRRGSDDEPERRVDPKVQDKYLGRHQEDFDDQIQF
jgi:single-stranded DNA-binding protein